MRAQSPCRLWPLALFALVACQSSEDASRPVLAVFAASSLTEAFAELERGFEAQNPEVDVVLTFAGSQVLRVQIEEGAGADLFASADERHMAGLATAGLVGRSVVFAHNELVVIVPADDPAGIQALDDLRRARRVVLGTDNVPVGSYARAVLQNATSRLGADFAREVERRVVSTESNVRLVRAKVELGEADAALVYRTDAVASNRVRVVPIARELNVRASYHIGQVSRGQQELGARFVDYVRSEAGRRALQRHGFGTEP